MIMLLSDDGVQNPTVAFVASEHSLSSETRYFHFILIYQYVDIYCSVLIEPSHETVF